MNSIVLERKKTELLNQLKTLADTAELTDEQRSASEDIRSKLDKISSDIAHHKKVEDIESRATAANKPAEKDWQRSIQDFKLTRLIASELGEKVDAGLEREVVDETRQRSDRKFEGLAVPIEALETRTVSTTAPTAGPGGRIIDDDYRPGMFIPLLRDALVMNQLGATVLRGLSGGTVKIPKAKAGMVAAWKTETGDSATDDLEFENPVELSPKTLAVIGEYSRYMMLQSSPDIEMLFRRDLSESLARSIDSAAIGGAGRNAPRGITDLVTATAQIAPSSGNNDNGKESTLADYYKLMQAIDTANVPNTSRAWLINFKNAYSAAQKVKFASAGSDTIYMNGQLLGSRTVVSNLVPSAGTKGSGTGLSTAIYGNWSDLIIGYWSELDLLLNPYVGSAFTKGNIQIRALMVCDFALRYTQSFGYYSDIIT